MKTMFLAFSPSKEGRRMSSPKRACIASCPSLATKAQNPSNHCSQQLPEVPPTNSDDTLPIAPWPPSSLTTELEPAARPQVPRNHWTQQLLAQCHQSLWRHHPDCTPAAKQLDDRNRARSQSPRTSQSLITATACTVPPTNSTTPARLHPNRQTAWRPNSSPSTRAQVPRNHWTQQLQTQCHQPTLTTPSQLHPGRQAAWRPSLSPQPDPKYHAITEHSNCLHSATNHFDDTIPIVPRPPSSLTTETEPAARAQGPRNHWSQQLHAQCHQPTRRHQPDYTPTAKRLDDRIQALQPEPKYLAISLHSNCKHSATNHIDDTNPNIPWPPSSLTTEYEPAARAQAPRNHCTQQLPARYHLFFCSAKQLDSSTRVHGLGPYHQDFGNAEQLDTALCRQAAWRKFVVQVLATDPPSTITAPQQLQHANTCRSTRTNYCKPTAMQPDTPRATFKPRRWKHAHEFPQSEDPPHSPFATRITHYNIILGKNGPKLSVPLDTARMLRLPPQWDFHWAESPCSGWPC